MRIGLAQGTPRFVGALWLVPLMVRGPWIRVGATALAVGTTWFFRDPERAPEGDGLLAPADGIVQWVRSDEEGRICVSTYLNLLDVHVSRSPCDANVVEQIYRRGTHRRASSPDANQNESMEWRLETAYGELVLTQYSGAVARRLVPYRSRGDALRRGERIGLIRFGSRVDLTVPSGFEVLVTEGMRLFAGRTVVARPESS